MTNDEGLFPLHLAHDKQVVTTMKSVGCDLNKRNKAGYSLLEIKTLHFDTKIIETLHKFKVNTLDPCPKGMYWMQLAERDDIDIAEILVNNFCDANYSNEQKENTFWVATIRRYFKMAIILRDAHADMNALSATGKTILHVAYDDKINVIFTFLLDAGASPNTKNKDEESVLFKAFHCSRQI